MKNLKVLWYLSLALLCVNCAGLYRKKEADRFDYYNFKKDEKGKIWYFYDTKVMKQNLNNKYNYKEKRENVQMVAVKIENRGQSSLVMDKENLFVHEEGRPLRVLSSREYFDRVRQRSGRYLFYSFLSYPGIFVGVLNMVVASQANGNLKQDLQNQNILGKEILSKRYLCGYMLLEDYSGGELTMSVERKSP